MRAFSDRRTLRRDQIKTPWFHARVNKFDFSIWAWFDSTPSSCTSGDSRSPRLPSNRVTGIFQTESQSLYHPRTLTFTCNLGSTVATATNNSSTAFSLAFSACSLISFNLLSTSFFAACSAAVFDPVCYCYPCIKRVGTSASNFSKSLAFWAL